MSSLVYEMEQVAPLEHGLEIHASIISQWVPTMPTLRENETMRKKFSESKCE